MITIRNRRKSFIINKNSLSNRTFLQRLVFVSFSPRPIRCSLGFRGGGGGGAFADDFEDCLGVLGAVVVDLLAEVGDESAGRERDGRVGIEPGAGADPPGAGEDGDEAVVGVEMGMAEMTGSPFHEDDVEAGLRRVAGNDGHLRADGIVGPMDLIGQFVGDSLGVKIGGFPGCKCGGKGKDECQERGRGRKAVKPENIFDAHGILLGAASASLAWLEIGKGKCLPAGRQGRQGKLEPLPWHDASGRARRGCLLKGHMLFRMECTASKLERNLRQVPDILTRRMEKT